MKSKVYWAFGLLFAASVVLSACAAPGAPAAPAYSVAPTAVPQAAAPAYSAAPTAVPPTAAPANPPTSGGGTNVPMTAATLMVVKDATLGQFLADEKGMTLYLFTKDDKNTSNCYDKCATAWPPLLSAGQPKGMEGVTASLLGTTQRKDGSMQVTYNGYPLYYYAKDEKPGDVTGQGVGDVWYVISASGEMVKAATVKLADDAKLGKFLADDKGRTLYMYTKDDKNVTNCYDKCATAWPPLQSAGQPKGLDGINAALLGTTQRKDGTLQATYNGYPLYYYAKDEKPGDVKGQGVGDVWYVLSASGEIVKGAVSSAPVASSGQPYTDSTYK